MSKLQVNESKALFKTGIITDKYDDAGVTKYDVTVGGAPYIGIESHYHCDSAASSHGEPFSVSDSVVVYFEESTPQKIIGFIDNPRSCGCISVLIELLDGSKERYNGDEGTFVTYTGSVEVGNKCVAGEYCNDSNNLCYKEDRNFYKFSGGCLDGADNIGELFELSDNTNADILDDTRTSDCVISGHRFITIGGSYIVDEDNIINIDELNWMNETEDRSYTWDGTSRVAAHNGLWDYTPGFELRITQNHIANFRHIGDLRWVIPDFKKSWDIGEHYNEVNFGLHAIYLSDLEKLVTLSYSSFRESASLDCTPPQVGTGSDYSACLPDCIKGETIVTDSKVGIQSNICSAWPDTNENQGSQFPSISYFQRYAWTDKISLCFDGSCIELETISSLICGAPATVPEVSAYIPLISVNTNSVLIFEFNDNAFFTVFYANSILYAFKGCLEDGSLSIERDTTFENRYSGQTISKIELE